MRTCSITAGVSAGAMIGFGLFLACRGPAPSVASSSTVLQHAGIPEGIVASLERLRTEWTAALPMSQEWWFVARTPDENPVSGTFSLTAGQTQYVDRLTIDQPSALLSSFDTAYDGTRHEILDKVGQTVSVRANDPGTTLSGVPQPLMLAWDFLSRDDDTCPLCALRPSHLADQNFWAQRIGGMTVLSHNADDGITLVQFPGGTLDGNPFVYHVSFVGEAGFQTPTRIARVRPNGTMLTEVLLPGYVWSSGVPHALVFPTHITVAAIAGEGRADIIYGLVELRSDGQALGADAFSVDPARARRVWDSDAQQFIR